MHYTLDKKACQAISLVVGFLNMNVRLNGVVFSIVEIFHPFLRKVYLFKKFILLWKILPFNQLKIIPQNKIYFS